MDTFNIKVGNRVKNLREKVGLRQEVFAEKLGITRPVISQIEQGKRKLTAQELDKIAGIFNLSTDVLLGKIPMPEIEISQEEKQKISEPSIRINIPQKNLNKFREVLLYILNEVGSKPHIGETVIYKLLYFIDFNYYEKHEEQLIGANYIKNHYGPTPVEFQKIVEKMIRDHDIEKINSQYFSYPQTKYLPLRKPDLSKFSANELEIINDVLCKLADMNAAQISEYSHNDVPWLTTEENKPLEYESVFYRTSPYSVREYPDEV